MREREKDSLKVKREKSIIIRPMKLTVIIPAYNEKNTIREIIHRVAKTQLANEILVVDDGSTDGTREILAELEGTDSCRVIYHEKNKGKGAAVRTGILEAMGDVLLIQDADLEYNHKDYPALLQPVDEGIAEVVFGSDPASTPADLFQMVANKILIFVTNIHTITS
jgi:glycosyltransferase involved in cell wall biosynthesis